MTDQKPVVAHILGYETRSKFIQMSTLYKCLKGQGTKLYLNLQLESMCSHLSAQLTCIQIRPIQDILAHIFNRIRDTLLITT